MKKRNKIVDFISYLGFRVIVIIFHMFSIDRNLRTGRILGKWMWYAIGRDLPIIRKVLRRKHREQIMENLTLALGDEYSKSELEKIGEMSCRHLVMFAIDCLFTTRLISLSTWKGYVTLKSFEPALKILLEHNAALFLTGHYGSWEVLGYTLATLGYDTASVMRPLDNPYMNKYMVDIREHHGLKLLYKKGASSTMEDVLNEGTSLGFIADQDAGRKGVFVDFFGRKASTYKSIGLVARAMNLPVLIGCARRTSWETFKYELDIEDIIMPEDWESQEDELLYITQRYSKAIENMVRKDPSQYLWMHRRWKSRPRGERRA